LTYNIDIATPRIEYCSEGTLSSTAAGQINSNTAVMATQIPVDPTLNSANTLKLENTHNRDVLIAIEKKYQKKWQDDKVFEVDAPTTDEVPVDSISARNSQNTSVHLPTRT
jgi:hypothetical protein